MIEMNRPDRKFLDKGDEGSETRRQPVNNVTSTGCFLGFDDGPTSSLSHEFDDSLSR